MVKALKRRPNKGDHQSWLKLIHCTDILTRLMPRSIGSSHGNYHTLFRSPLIIVSFKMMLIYTASIQILIAIMTGFLQGRIVKNSLEETYFPIGPCRLFGPWTCFAIHTNLHALSLYVEILIVHTMYFRYRMMQPLNMLSEKLGTSLIIAAVLPTIVAILPHVGPLHFDTFTNETTIREHPEKHLEESGEVEGYTLTGVPITVTSLISFTVTVTSPIIIFCLKRAILKKFHNSQEEHSERIKNISKLFLKALTAQAMIPLCCYMPMTFVFYVNNTYQWNFAIIEYLVIAIPSLPCVIDPLCTIYFVAPYRAWVSETFRRLNFTEFRQRMQGSTVTTVTTTAVQQ